MSIATIRQNPGPVTQKMVGSSVNHINTSIIHHVGLRNLTAHGVINGQRI
jgi:hypothetical protein